MRETDVTLSRPRRAAKVGFQPMEPGARPHVVKHPFSFRDEQVSGLPGGDKRTVQRLARNNRTPLGLFMEAVDFRHGGRCSWGRVHDGIPVVSRKLSAS